MSNRGPSAYQPNALPLGQTGSLKTITIRTIDTKVVGSQPVQSNLFTWQLALPTVVGNTVPTTVSKQKMKPVEWLYGVSTDSFTFVTPENYFLHLKGTQCEEASCEPVWPSSKALGL